MAYTLADLARWSQGQRQQPMMTDARFLGPPIPPPSPRTTDPRLLGPPITAPRPIVTDPRFIGPPIPAPGSMPLRSQGIGQQVSAQARSGAMTPENFTSWLHMLLAQRGQRP